MSADGGSDRGWSVDVFAHLDATRMFVCASARENARLGTSLCDGKDFLSKSFQGSGGADISG